MVDRRDVELVMQVKDLSTAAFKTIKQAVDELTGSLNTQLEAARKNQIGKEELNETQKKLAQSSAALANQQGLIDTFNKTTRAAQEQTEKLEKAQAALSKHAATLKEGEEATKSWTAKQDSLTRAVTAAEKALTTSKTRIDTTTASLRQAGIETNNLSATQKELLTTAERVGQAQTELAAGVLAYARNARIARDEAKALADAERAQATAAKDAAAAEASAARETAAAAATAARNQPKPAAAANAQQQKGFLGLRPYELQNLSYQVNDVFTQIAGGTSITQTAAQQGGQILQLFSKNIFDLIPMVARLTPYLAGLAVVFLSVGRAASLRESTKQFTADLAATVDGANYSAEALTKTRVAIQNLGVSWDDASKLIQQAISAGLRPDMIQKFAQASQDLADRTGIKVPDAMKLLVEGFTHGFDAVQKLNDQYNFLKAGQLDLIKSLFDSGDQAKANAVAFDLLATHQRDAAELGLGAWGRASREAGVAYRSLLDYIGNTAIVQAFGGAWNGVAKIFEGVARVVERVTRATDPTQLLRTQLEAARTGLDQLNAQQARGSLRQTRLPDELPDAITAQQKLIADLQKRISDADFKSLDGKGTAKSSLTQPSEAETARGKQIVQTLNEQIAATKGLNDAEAIRLAGVNAVRAAQNAGELSPEAQAQIKQIAEDEQRRIIRERDYTKSIQDRTQAEKDNANSGAIIAAGERAKDAARAAGIESVTKLDEVQKAAEAEERTRIQRLEQEYENAAQQRARRAADGVNASRIQAAGERELQAARAAGILDEGKLLAIRRQGEDAERSRVSQEKSAASKANSAENSRESQARALQNELSSLQRAGGNKGLVDLQTQLAEIDARFDSLTRNVAKYNKSGGTTIGGKSVADFTQTADDAKQRAKDLTSVTYQEGEINRIIQERNALVQTYGALVETGSVSQFEAQTKIKEAYASTSPLVQQATEDLQKFLDAAQKSGGVSGTQFDLMTAKIKEFRAQATYVDPLTASIEKNLKSGVSSAVVSGFDGITSAIGDLVTGVGNAGTVLQSFGTAAAGVFKSVANAILQAIVQAYVLQAVSKVTGTGGILQALGLAGGAATAAGGAAASGGAAQAAEIVATGLYHSGGVVGQGSMFRSAPTSVFSRSPRLHSGGVLASDEQAAILQRGEEVLAKNDPRNVLNGGGGGSAPQSIRNVLAFGDDELAGALKTSAGEKVVLSHIKRNVGTIRQLIRG